MELKTDFFLAPAPRVVPLSLRLSLLLGGLGQVGWLILGFGMVFFWGFAWRADLSFVLFYGPRGQAEGRITEITQTGASVGGGEGRAGTPIYAYRYRFADPAGVERTGVSYRTGRAGEVGDAVTVEYPRGWPTMSRIAGMRREIWEAWAVLLALLPLLGLAFIVARARSGRKAAHLLQCGSLALGVLKSKEATNIKVNKRDVYKLTFEFQSEERLRYTVETRTTEPEVLEDQEQERIVYDPQQPTYAMLLDDLPGQPKVDEEGQFRPKGLRAAALLILPLLTIAANVAFVAARVITQ